MPDLTDVERPSGPPVGADVEPASKRLMTVREALAGRSLPIRAKHIVEDTWFGDTPLTETHRGLERLRIELHRVRNIGAETVRTLRVALSDVGFPPGPAAWARRDVRVEWVDEHGGAGPTALPGVDTPVSFMQACRSVIETMPLRMKDVVERKHGLSGTIELNSEIARSLRVSPELVRQIHLKGLRLIGEVVGEDCASRFMAAWMGTFLDELFEGDYLLHADVTGRMRRLSPAFAMAFALSGMKIQSLLAMHARWHMRGWFRGAKGSRVDLLEADMRPMPFRAVDDPVLARALVLERRAKVIGGYVTSEGMRSGVALLAHAVLARHGGSLAASELGERMSAFAKGRPFDPELIRTTAYRLPHLFLVTANARLASLGSACDPRVVAEAVKGDLIVRKYPVGPEVLLERETVRGLLENRKVMRGRPLTNEVGKRLHPGKNFHLRTLLEKRASLATRILPGVYALEDRLDEVEGWALDEMPPDCFNANQATLYARARYAGERHDAFPFWSFSFEYGLCALMESQGHDDILDSLLAVSDPEAWPVGGNVKARWRALKRERGAFRLRPSVAAVSFRRPSLPIILAACHHAKDLGGFNCMAATRVGEFGRYGTKRGVAIMTVLVMIGALGLPADPDDWLAPHPLGEGLDDILSGLSTQTHRRGVLDWDGPVGQGFVEAAWAWVGCDGDGRQPRHGWIDPSSARRMIEGSDGAAGS